MNYRHLIRDLKNIVDDGLVDRKQDMNLATTITNWELGKRLVVEEQTTNRKFVYGKQVLQKISDDLRKRYGQGYGMTNLRYMRQFHLLYLKKEIKEQLQWSHYRLLVKIKNKRQRKNLESKVVKQGWSYRELLIAIRHSQNIHSEDVAGNQLERPTGVTGIVQVRRIVEDDKELFFLDMGFNFWIPAESFDLNAFEHKQLVSILNQGSTWGVQAYDGDSQSRWLYLAKLDKVIDADTIVVFIYPGLGMRTRQIIRLRSVNAASLQEKAGIEASDFVKKLLTKASFLLLKTRQRDKYSRFVADVLIGYSGESITKVLQSGLFLNQELLDQNLAIRVG